MIYLVSCSKKKSPATKCAARDMYTSTLFRLSKKYVGQKEWYILSAKYGLLHPDDIITTYDVSFDDLNKQQKEEWTCRVAADLIRMMHTDKEVCFLCGGMYSKRLGEVLEESGFRTHYPLAGMGIGTRQKFLKENAHE